MSTHPLEVPEILTRIGQFLPLWVEQDDSNRGEKIMAFEHRTLLSSMQVSKLWYQTLLPILWFSYDGIKMSAIPQKVITRYSPYFRIFRSSGCHSGPFLSTHLVELTIYIQMMDQRISLEAQRALIRANPRLRYLVWHGPDRTTELEMEDFVGLKSLQELRLFHWDGGERRLAKVLGAVKETIRTFEVSRIKGVLPGDLSGALHRRLNPVYHPEEQEDDYIISLNNYNRSNSDSNSAATMTETDLAALVQTEQEEDRLVLPYMEKIKVIFDRNPDYVELAQCCPNLKRLTVTGLGHGETYRLSLCLRDHCQKLRVLVLKDVLLPQEDAIQLLRSCLSAGGLTKIHMDVIGFEQDCISAILLHASTLEQLTIASTAEDAVDLEGVLRIMVKCEKLRSLRFMLDTSVPDVDVLEAWRAEAWACTGLEKLGLEFNYCEFGYEDYSEDDDDEEEEEEKEEDYLDGGGGSSEDKDKETVDHDRERREEEEEVRLDKLTVGLAAKKGKEEGDGGEKMIISSETPYMGWYRHPQESHDFGASRRSRDETDKAALRMLFGMVEGFKKLHTVKWKDIEYSRSSTPPRCRHIK
ncbi:hypothetical protein KI688_000738 [Linnemannia hyalina]|uniref:F-box domain-containing protein n=1 Tax=Linnemannia hyalina TaxID=64524 RepID=A0A9P8C025_9FUNG|nr:hypothetical protein KI688_000738 [Linnemannia hyalina]